MDMQIEKRFSFTYEFNPAELVVDSDDIYKRSLEIIQMEANQEKSEEDIARLEGLRRIEGYVGGYEIDYRIEGFDFVKLNEDGDIKLFTFLSPLVDDEYETPTQLFAPGEVSRIFKYQQKEGGGVGGKFELKTHEFDDSGDKSIAVDHSSILLHPIVIPIWEPYKVERVKKVLKDNPNRELIEFS
ncbi:MAG: hypothetical protein XD87_0202 [candidate division WS6 bacterium 36_33]|uniref:Uncharacterized protein n=1 Tax=candidate division WS6 bacterium 36_33 TaxID=1641388 RepID=A0A117LU13_9BACT|nr:MAG: hypothetical protein XD87_0202 [candidate division WS6 bacterium 36_33]